MYEFALQLIEHELGRSFRTAETTETVRVSASFAPLKHKPILTVKSVKARMKNWEHSNVFGQMQAIEIPLTEIEFHSTGIHLPLTLWGSYDEASVTYEYGFGRIPTDIEQAARIIEEQLAASGSVPNVYTAQLLLHSDEVETLLQPYRR